MKTNNVLVHIIGRWLPLFVLAFSLNAGAAGFLQACYDVWFRISQPYQYNIQVAKELMPAFIAEHRSEWENSNRISDPGAVLKDLQTVRDSNLRIRNETFRAATAGGSTAIVKKTHLRNDIAGDFVGAGRVNLTQINNHPEFEALAYLFDENIEFNIVPPATMLDPQTSVQILVSGGAIGLKTAPKFPEFFLDLSSSIVMDFAFANSDRIALGNLLRNQSRLWAIDFDLSDPVYAVPEAAAARLWVDGVIVGGKKTRLPIVMTQRNFNNIRNLDPQKIYAQAQSRNIKVGLPMIQKVAGAFNVIASALEKLQEELGCTLILPDHGVDP